VHLEHRFEHLVGFIDRDPGRGDDGHLALDALIDDEVFTGEFADELDQHADIHLVEINGDRSLRPVCRRAAARGLTLLLDLNLILVQILGGGAGSKKNERQRSDKRTGHPFPGSIHCVFSCHIFFFLFPPAAGP
jgi:hypothetical protein